MENHTLARRKLALQKSWSALCCVVLLGPCSEVASEREDKLMVMMTMASTVTRSKLPHTLQGQNCHTRALNRPTISVQVTMQNNAELQRTLNELCTDLFATSAIDNCSSILQSLALLAEAFPHAQSLIGRLLSQPEDNQDRPWPITVSKLSTLSSNFLYNKETARSTVYLLAVLANNNYLNQRRIVQNVIGVKLEINPRKRGALATGSNLYALTVPVTVTNTYRRWKKRQQKLQNCRLPSGVPPTHDGIPMPCYCDNCLGAEQLLSTWQQHFRDLSRWSLDDDIKDATSSARSLSTKEFFRMFLEDFELRVCTVGGTMGKQKQTDGSNRYQSVVYYLVPPEEGAPVQFSPLRHVSAIAIAAEIDIETTRIALLQSRESPSLKLPESSILAADQVILFSGTLDIKSCRPEDPESEASLCCQHQAVDSNELLLADFLRFEEQHGQLAQYDSLVDDVGGEDSEMAETTRRVLLRMLAFCESGDRIPLSVFRRCLARSVDSKQAVDDSFTFCKVEGIESAPLKATITMTAVLTDQVLQIDCAVTTVEGTSSSFSTRVPQQELINMNDPGDEGNLSLLYLSDDALEILIQRCRICTCENQENHVDGDELFYLRSSTFAEDQSVKPSDGHTIVAHGNQQDCAAVRPPLSSKAKRVLVEMETVVSEEKYRRWTCGRLTTVMEKLATVVADCNARISYLSTAKDKKLVVMPSEVHRSAVISRCRHCRDLLIQLGKKVALKAKPLDTSASISEEKLWLIAKMIHSSIQGVLVHSENFDPWEIPDARVKKLQLDHRIWASGYLYPDAAFYRDFEARRRENRKKQQQLSRKLLLKKRKSNDEARVRQQKSMQS